VDSLSCAREPDLPIPSRDPAVRTLYVALGIDCDQDRDVYPRSFAFRGVESLPRLFDIPRVRWTLNIRADSHVARHAGSADFCFRKYRPVWDAALERGCALAWHLHYYDDDDRQDVSETNIDRNVRLGSEALPGFDIVHMGWTFQNEHSIRRLREVGVTLDYSPLPRMTFGGRNGTDAYDWSEFEYRPTIWQGVRMIPAFTYPDPLLARRFGTERVMLTTCTAPPLYNRLLRAFFRTDADFFVSYFHADEIISALGDWRRHLYSFRNLERNIKTIERMAAHHDRVVEWVNIRELGDVLFREDRTRHS